MAPAYFLFGLQLQMQNKEISNTIVYWIIGVFLLVMVCILIFLKRILDKRYKGKSGHNINLSITSRKQIIKKNGDVVAFLMGTILPSVLIIEEHLKETLVIFIILQGLIFILTSRSSNVFPNILLMLVGVDIYELNNGKYILTLSKTLKPGKKPKLLVSLGDSELCNTYLITGENEN